MNIVKSINQTNVIGDFKSFYVILLFPIGSMSDPLNYHGLAHLCEHYILSSIKEKSNRNISIYGETHFDHTICLFRSTILKDIENIIENLVNEDFSKIDMYSFTEAQNEVIKELNIKCLAKEKEFSFVTDNAISHLPVGDKSILDITPPILCDFLSRNYKQFHVIYLGKIKGNFKLNELTMQNKNEKLIYYSENKILYQSNDISNSFIYIFFLIHHNHDTLYLVFSYLMIYLSRKLSLKFRVYDKTVNKNNTLLYLILESDELDNVKNFIDELVKYKISESDIVIIKRDIKCNLKRHKNTNITSIISMLSREVLYHENAIITECDLNEINKRISSISKLQLEKFKNYVFKEKYHIVIKDS